MPKFVPSDEDLETFPVEKPDLTGHACEGPYCRPRVDGTVDCSDCPLCNDPEYLNWDDL